MTANLKHIKQVTNTLGLNERPSFNTNTFRSLAAEFIATFTFLFIAMSAGTNLHAAETPSPAVSGIAVAMAATAVIYSFGGLSGAHFNPAVTLGSIVGFRMNIFKGVMYIGVQLLAAFAATGLLMFLYPDDKIIDTLVLTPKGPKFQAVVIEMLMSFFLVMTIYATALGKAPTIQQRKEQVQETIDHDNKNSMLPSSSKEVQLTIEHADKPAEGGTYDPNKPFAGLAIGFMLGCLCYVGGFVSGGGFNPARATAPAVLAGDISNLWVYWVGDFLGGGLAALIYLIALS